MEVSQKTKDISVGNDLFRTNFSGEKIIITEGVNSSPHRTQIIEAVKNFTDFNESNDPDGDHTFGSFTIHGNQFFFKIDYFDTEWNYGADPYDNSVFERVLTVMRSDEY